VLSPIFREEADPAGLDLARAERPFQRDPQHPREIERLVHCEGDVVERLQLPIRLGQLASTASRRLVRDIQLRGAGPTHHPPTPGARPARPTPPRPRPGPGGATRATPRPPPPPAPTPPGAP